MHHQHIAKAIESDLLSTHKTASLQQPEAMINEMHQVSALKSYIMRNCSEVEGEWV